MNTLAPTSAAAPASAVIGRRIGAALIDLVVLTAAFVVFGIAFGDSSSSGGQASVHTGSVATLAFLALALLYYFTCEAIGGQTPGKRALGVRVVSATGGGRPGAGAIGMRTLLRLVDGLPFFYLVGFVSMLATGERAQRLGDMAARTTVVDARR